MDLPVKFFNTFVPELIENNVRVNVMGYIDMLPKKTQKAVYDAIEQTSNCTGMVLNFALNYGGDRKSTRLNSSHVSISYAVFCLKKKKGEESKIKSTRRSNN